MAKPTTLPFGKFLIKLGNGATPEIFTSPCGLTSKGFNETASTQDTVVPDCDDPDKPAYVERDVDSLSAEISGSGVLAMEAFPTWRTWFASGLAKNCRIYLDETMANYGGYYEGAFHLTTFNKTGTRGNKVSVEVTMMSDGEYTWTNADA